jgi:hypothetical protein
MLSLAKKNGLHKNSDHISYSSVQSFVIFNCQKNELTVPLFSLWQESKGLYRINDDNLILDD